MKLVGEVGSGKTMICRTLERFLPDRVFTVYLSNPSIAAQDILLSIALKLGIPVSETISGPQLMHAVEEELTGRFTKGQRVVVFLEDAQALTVDTLEEIRLLGNMERGSAKLLQIVMLGQPELDETLQNHAIRQLCERISHSFFLRPLTREETAEYIDFRVQSCGYSGQPLFTSDAISSIHQAVGGSIRRINILADKALLGAFAQNKRTVDTPHIQTALMESAFSAKRRTRFFHDNSLPITQHGRAETADTLQDEHRERTPDTQGESADLQREKRPKTAWQVVAGVVVGVACLLYPATFFQPTRPLPAVHTQKTAPKKPAAALLPPVDKKKVFLASLNRNGKKEPSKRQARECVGCDLSGADLRKADLSEANLSWASLHNAKLSGADLSSSIMENTNLQGADLTGANLRHANLAGINGTGAIFTRADMTATNLTKARLKKADLRDAILNRAMLKGADMTGALHTGAALEGAYLAGTVLDTEKREKRQGDSPTKDATGKKKTSGR